MEVTTKEKDARTEWFIEPLDGFTNGILTQRIDASEEKEVRRTDSATTVQASIWSVGFSFKVVQGMIHDRRRDGLRFRILRRREGERSLTDVTTLFLNRKRKKRTAPA